MSEPEQEAQVLRQAIIGSAQPISPDLPSSGFSNVPMGGDLGLMTISLDEHPSVLTTLGEFYLSPDETAMVAKIALEAVGRSLAEQAQRLKDQYGVTAFEQRIDEVWKAQQKVPEKLERPRPMVPSKQRLKVLEQLDLPGMPPKTEPPEAV